MDDEYYSQLIPQQLKLIFQTTAIILPSSLQVIVHLLNVSHKIGKMRSFHCETLVFLNETSLDALK